MELSENVEIKNGDCLELMKEIPDKSVDMILCDLPYGTTVCKWDTIIPLEPLWDAYKRIIKKNGVIALTSTQPFTSLLVTSNIKWFKYEWIWIKQQGVDPFMSKIRPLNNIENILVFCEGSQKYNAQMRTGIPYYRIRDNKKVRIKEHNNVVMKKLETTNYGDRFPVRTLEFKQERGKHPTQKPVSLLEYLIKTYTDEGQKVLDNTMGSGSTGVACVRTNRKFIGYELEKKYFDIAKDRLTKEINDIKIG